MEITTGNLATNREQWASIDGYLNYEISWWGRVRNTTTGRILKGGTISSGYSAVILCKEGKRKNHSVHVLVASEWVGNPDGKRCVDHMDNDKTNNNWKNLRWATSSENSRNMRKHWDGSSSFKGVSWDKRAGKWRTQILVNRKVKTLGRYLSEREAADVYNAAAIEHYGVFAKLNDLITN